MSISSIRSAITSKTREKNTYTKRKKKIETARSNLNTSLNDEITSLNKQIGNCSSELEKAIKGYSQIALISDSIDCTKERAAADDTDLSDCYFHLSNEITRCGNKISSLENEIAVLQEQLKAELRKKLDDIIPF